MSSRVASRWCPSRTQVSGGAVCTHVCPVVPCESLFRGRRQGQTMHVWVGRAACCSLGLGLLADRLSFNLSMCCSEKRPCPGRRGTGAWLCHRHLQKGQAGPD